jgi:hypothetical protein
LEDLNVNGMIILKSILKKKDVRMSVEWIHLLNFINFCLYTVYVLYITFYGINVSFGSGKGPVAVSCEYGSEALGSIKAWKILD